MTIQEIDLSTKQYADARAALAAQVQELNDAVEQLRRKRMPDIKAAVARASERACALRNKLESAPELFTKPLPRTHVLHGIKVGYTLAKERLEWQDDEALIAAIREHLSRMSSALIKTTEAPVKKALEGLTACQLDTLGIAVIPGSDEIVIKPTDSQTDKIVAALLKDAEKEAA